MRAWWRRWVWVPRRDRWRFKLPPMSLAYMDYLMQEHYAVHLRAAVNEANPLWDHLTHTRLHEKIRRARGTLDS